jgi:hypothetical protein
VLPDGSGRVRRDDASVLQKEVVCVFPIDESGARRGVLVVGPESVPLSALRAALACDEVFVLARAVPVRGGRLLVVDEDAADQEACERLTQIARWLRSHGVQVHGAVGDPDPEAARRDAQALAPGSLALN